MPQGLRRNSGLTYAVFPDILNRVFIARSKIASYSNKDLGMKEIILSRRMFLKASLAGSILLLGGFEAIAQSPASQLTEGLQGTAPLEEQQEEGVIIEAAPAFPRAAPQYEGEGRITLYNTHTGERLRKFVYRKESGDYDPEALVAINRFMRCPYTHEVKEIDIRVIEFLNELDNKLGGDNEITVISGYRSQEYNDILRRRRGIRRRVAKNSLHLAGMAIDFNIPGVRLKKVRKKAEGMRWGGVGYYPRSRFIHIDCGRVRHW